MLSRKCTPLRLYCCSGDAIHNLPLRSGIQTPFSKQLTQLSMERAETLFASHKQVLCHHTPRSRLTSQLFPPSSLVQQVWLGYRIVSFWGMETSIWQCKPEAKKQEAIKVLKGFQAPQGNYSIPYLALSTSCKTQPPPLSNQEGTSFILVVSTLSLIRLSEATP